MQSPGNASRQAQGCTLCPLYVPHPSPRTARVFAPERPGRGSPRRIHGRWRSRVQRAVARVFGVSRGSGDGCHRPFKHRTTNRLTHAWRRGLSNKDPYLRHLFPRWTSDFDIVGDWMCNPWGRFVMFSIDLCRGIKKLDRDPREVDSKMSEKARKYAHRAKASTRGRLEKYAHTSYDVYAAGTLRFERRALTVQA